VSSVDEADLTLEQLDRDGALREAIERLDEDHGTRAEVLRRAAVGSTAFLAALALPGGGAAAPAARDRDILNYALVLEYLQSAFYTETEREGALRGKAKRASVVVGAVERAHVDALRKVLGRAAVPRPLFNFQGVTEQQTPFLRTAVAFEDLAVAAYKGQATRIQAKPLLIAAVSIHSVEARHAAWMRYLFGITPAADAFDDALSRPQVESIVAKTRFIASRSRTARAGRSPRLTG
jgi:Ferritin-like domain